MLVSLRRTGYLSVRAGKVVYRPGASAKDGRDASLFQGFHLLYTGHRDVVAMMVTVFVLSVVTLKSEFQRHPPFVSKYDALWAG